MSCRAELYYQVVYDLLRSGLIKHSVLHISLYVDIKEGRATSEGHRRSVLLLVSRKISKIGPLNRFSGIRCGLTYIKSVDLRHSLKLLEEVYLAIQLLKQLYVHSVHRALSHSLFVFRLLRYKSIYTVKSYSAVVADYSSSAVSIGKSCQKRAMSCLLHLIGIYAKNSVIVGRSVCKVFLYLVRKLIAVSLAGRARHTDTAKGVYSSFKRLVGLESYYYLVFPVNISRSVVTQGGYRAGVYISDTAVCPFLCLKLLQLCIQSLCSVGCSNQKIRISRVRCIVFVNKVAYVDMLLPISRNEALPCIKFHNRSYLSVFTFAPTNVLPVKKQSTPVKISELPRRSALKERKYSPFWCTVLIHVPPAPQQLYYTIQLLSCQYFCIFLFHCIYLK